ncbi:PREDICTED: zona pellucida sperm-binding protein 1 isoform X1 [Corvus brachyrhynchos]|uniref:zona pellucida sperm-binding protein 1 isoform X1 n=1 Tax=Corvus brachyrhynchos TaxID=85066 RepID=UPI0004DDDF62|nr:PREDICTED: zona pellucida sperm-binding protein 1 isoform X1 [Corvus brachyrhynchos]
MGQSYSFLLLLFLLSPWPRATVALLQYRYDCGELGMQLLVFPSHGRTVRFTVLDEFGSRFDVANCSICLHWLNSREDGSVIFSSGYKGCHVLFKENRYILRVQLEELLSSGIPVTSYEVNMTCPKPGGSEMIPNGNRERGRDNGVLISHTGLLHRISESSLTRAESQLSSRDHLEQVHTVGQHQTNPELPGIWHHSSPAHSGFLSQPSGVRPITQIQGSFIHPGVQPPQPGGQSQPGILRPVLVSQNHPSLVHPGGQTQPGHLRPGFVSHNQPGMLHPGGQNQPGIRLGSVSHNQPGMVHPGGQNQPGIRPGSVSHNQPGMVHPGGQNQPGIRPGSVSHNQPGMVHPGGQNQPGIRPGSVSHNQPGMVHPAGQNQPGIRPGSVSHNQPGMVHPAGQNQPGIRPGSVSHNQPGMVHPAGQNQPGIRPGSVSHNQPGMVHPGGQNQPGIRPGFGSQNQPGGQNQPGQLRPGFVSQNPPRGQNQPGLRPGLVSHSQPGLIPTGAQTPAGFLRPGAQPPNQPGISRPSHHSNSQTGLQGHAGLLHPGHPSPAFVRPGLPSWPGLFSPGLQAQPQLGLGRPGLQPQPGLLHPGIHSQPTLLQSTVLFYPSAGAGMQLTREQCQVPVGRMACVAPQGRDGCLQAGCCYDDMDRATPCYYGNTATVQCLLEGHFVLVVPRGMVAPPYNLDSVRLASSQAGCEPLHMSEAFVMFRFPVTHCGTTVQVIEDRLIYENQLISTIDIQGSPRGSITRDSVYILRARCIYNASDLLPLGVEVAVPPTAAPLAMPGPLGLQLRIATDESYSSYHPVGDFPLVRVLRDPIYVEVRLLQKTDPNLVLVLHHCWASPGSHATSQPQWPILVEGCPFQGDNYRTRLIPVGPASPELPFPSHYQRFVISTFAFVETSGMAVLEGEVYISCSASVCHLAQPEPCRPSCQLGVPSRARRSLGDRSTGDGMGTVTSQGCVIFPNVPKGGGTQQRG